MRICHVITRLIVGGAQENTILTCKGLAARGHEVTLITGAETGPEGSLHAEAEASGAVVKVVEDLVRRPSPIRDWRCARTLKRMFAEGRFDVVHTHSSKAGILGRWAASRQSRLVLHTIHGLSFNRTQSSLRRWFYRAMERKAARWTDGFVTVADAMTDQAVEAGIAPRDRFTTVYSGMKTEQFRPDPERRRAVRAAWGIGPSEVVVGTVARMFRNKGYEELIPALVPAVANTRSLRFVWVGDGAQRNQYERSVREAGMADHVRFVGLVRPDEVPGLISGFDLLVHASRWEGLPRSVVQSLLTGVPAISFDVDGAPEVIEDGVTGRLVGLGDSAGLAGAIVGLAGAPGLRSRMGAEGRRLCLERFDAERMVDALESLYVSLSRDVT